MEKEVLEKLYRAMYRELFLYALFLSGKKDEAEDLVQEAFIKALLSYQKGNFRAWMCRVMRNMFFNERRKNKKEILDDGSVLNNVAAMNEDVLEKLFREERKQKLVQEIMRLPKLMKEVLLESVYMHLDDEEISRMHQISKGNVRQIRSRAKKRLMAELKEGEQDDNE